MKTCIVPTEDTLCLATTAPTEAYNRRLCDNGGTAGRESEQLKVNYEIRITLIKANKYDRRVVNNVQTEKPRDSLLSYLMS